MADEATLKAHREAAACKLREVADLVEANEPGLALCRLSEVMAHFEVLTESDDDKQHLN
jgi:hypothetical protein